MAYLVLGSGYIGAELIRQLLELGRRVVAFDNLFSTDIQALDKFRSNPLFEFAQGSVTSSTDLERAFSAAAPVAAVFNLAAQASGNPAAAAPEYTEDSNLRGPRLVCEAARQHGVGRLLYSSSTRVYGDPMPTKVTEDTPFGAFSDLSHLSKCYAEKLLEMYCSDGNIAGQSLRLGLTFGLSPVMKTDHRFMTAPNKFALLAAQGEQLVVTSSNWLGAVHVADAAGAFIFLADRPAESGYEVFNLAPIVARIDQMAQIVSGEAQTRGRPIAVQSIAKPAGQPQKPIIDSRLQRVGFQPKGELTKGLAETYRFFLARQPS